MGLTGHNGGMRPFQGWKAAVSFGLVLLFTVMFWAGVVWLVAKLF